MQLKDNTSFELPELRAGYFGGLDRLEIPHSILMLRQVLQREDNGNIELICEAKDGPEEKRGNIIFTTDDRSEKDALFRWLFNQIGKSIEVIYQSEFSLGVEML